ncbi:MAG: PepSY domain-containing protein [Tannerella sp.]|jgi:hypothetical protein|nr:PepSY domain-containing protein [Tannerella sp.]
MRFFTKYHKWGGLVIAFFVIMFSLSGIVLNHRKVFSSVDIPRKVLPEEFRFSNWNNAAAKGSLKLSSDSVLLYGTAGIWLTDSLQSSFSEFAYGMKKGADNQIVNRIVKASGGSIYAVTTFDFYKLGENNQWASMTAQAGITERIVDLEIAGDTMVILTRSHLYYSQMPFSQFTCVELNRPNDYTPETNLFRFFWLLHSGQLFGIAGQLFVDFLGLLLITLSITGVIYFFSPKLIKRRKRRNKPTKRLIHTMKVSVRWHNKIGILFLFFFLLLSVTGMFLRPPLLIAVVRSKIKNIPGTVLHTSNPWNDKLRTIRYEPDSQQYLLYTSSGFYTIRNFLAIPHKTQVTPPVSVMGVTVLEPTSGGWLVGSFSGLFHWNRNTGMIINCHTGELVRGVQRGRPVSTFPVSGYSSDFAVPVVFEYYKGALTFDTGRSFASMPHELEDGRMSLWHFALEVHTGRIYNLILGVFADLYVFLAGLLISLIFISGYILYRKKYKKRTP